jgi:hypothetical protein
MTTTAKAREMATSAAPLSRPTEDSISVPAATHRVADGGRARAIAAAATPAASDKAGDVSAAKMKVCEATPR